MGGKEAYATYIELSENSHRDTSANINLGLSKALRDRFSNCLLQRHFVNIAKTLTKNLDRILQQDIYWEAAQFPVTLRHTG